MTRPLPTNTSYTVHTIKIPSTGRQVKFRPYLVRENKMLMIAQQSQDNRVMLDTLKEIIRSCCVDDHPVDVEKLATFDFEYLLVKLRSISVDSHVEVNVVCQDHHDGFDPKTRDATILLDLDNIEVVGIDQYSTKVKLDDDLVVLMKQPSLDMIDSVPNDDDFQGNLKLVANQIDKICQGEEVYDSSEYSTDQLLQWLEQLTGQQLGKLLDYFNHIPYCRIKLEWTCPHCGKRNVRYIEGISYFF